MNSPRRTLRRILRGFHRSLHILGKLFDADFWASPFRWSRRPGKPRLVPAFELLEDRITPSVPSVSSVWANTGSTAGGAVYIYGSNLTGATAVDFGSTAASYTVENALEIEYASEWRMRFL